MGCLLFLLVPVLLLAVAMYAAVGLFGLVVTLIVAGLIGWAADAVVPGKLPFGWIGAVLAGILGGFVGHLVLRLFGIHNIGPEIAGVHLVPAFVGAVIIAGLAELLSGNRRLRQYM